MVNERWFSLTETPISISMILHGLARSHTTIAGNDLEIGMTRMELAVQELCSYLKGIHPDTS